MLSNSHCVEAMHALTRKTLCRTPAVFTGNTGTTITIPQVSAYPRPRPLYNTMRSSHAPSAKEHNDKEPEPLSAEDDRGDMAEAFGVAYATRSSEEGYGERYRESAEEIDSQKDTAPIQRAATADRNAAAREEHDESQGSEVKEKEQGRHATEESAYPPPDRPLPSGTGGVAS